MRMKTKTVRQQRERERDPSIHVCMCVCVRVCVCLPPFFLVCVASLPPPDDEEDERGTHPPSHLPNPTHTQWERHGGRGGRGGCTDLNSLSLDVDIVHLGCGDAAALGGEVDKGYATGLFVGGPHHCKRWMDGWMQVSVCLSV